MVLFDKRVPGTDHHLHDQMEVVQGDICDAETLDSALSGVDAVVHMATYGMSGQSNLPANEDIVERVNVGGTQELVDACLRNNVGSLRKDEPSMQLAIG